MEPTPVRPEARLVGRDVARRRVDALLDGLGAAPQRLVLVGETGIGKTTVWDYGLAAARARGYATLSCRPAEDDWARPGVLLRDFATESAPAAAALAGPLDRDDAAAALLALVRDLAAGSPVLLAVDDLPWLDEVSTRQLRFVLRRVAGLPVGLLATARTWDPAGAVTARVPRLPDVHELPLGPMEAGELRAVLAKEREALSRSELERLYQASGGNPMFALELVRADAPGRPASVQEAVAARLEAVRPEVRQLLELLAVRGACSLGELAEVAGAGTEEVVREAVAARLAVVDPDFTVRCSHPVVAAAVASALDPLARRDVHRRWLDHTSDPLLRAVHLSRCTMAADAAVAVELDGAAQLAARRGSSHLAADLAGHAVRLTVAGDPVLDARITRHLLQLAASGQTGRATELADRRLLDLGPGPARAEVITLRVMLDFVGAERYLRQALAAEGLDAGQHQLLLDLLGWQLGLFKGRLAEGIATSEQAVAEAEALGDARRVARASAVLAATSMMAGRPRRELARKATEWDGLDRAGAELLGIWPEVLQARQLAWDGRLPEARTTLERMYRRAVELGSELQRPYRLRDLALVELSAGEPRRAAERVLEGLDAARDAENRQVEAWLAQPAGLLAALRGDADTAQWAVGVLNAWAELADEPPRRAMAAHIQGLVAANRGDWESALKHYAAAADLLAGFGYRHPGVGRIAPDAVVAAGSVGDREHAERLAEELAAGQRALQSPWVEAWARAARGVVALLAGEPEAAETLAQASRELVGMGYRLDAAELSWLLGAARLRAGQRVRAREELAEALAQVEGWGFEGWAAQLRLVLARLGDGGALLTATEERVVELVRAGRRNREVAAELFVTESTVEAHLTRIYRKLQVRNRTELLAALTGA